MNMKRHSAGRKRGTSFPTSGLGARRRAKGFKLVELVAVLAIASTVGVSAVSASYDSSGDVDAARANAQLAMAEIASLEEQYFLNNKRYTEDLRAIGLPADTATTPGGHYALTVEFPKADACPTGFCYIVSAVPQGPQAGDDCGTLSLTSDGTRLPAGCW